MCAAGLSSDETASRKQEETTMATRISRRRALQIGAAVLPLVHVRTGHAVGKLALAFWDHWVSGGNDVMTQ